MAKAQVVVRMSPSDLQIVVKGDRMRTTWRIICGSVLLSVLLVSCGPQVPVNGEQVSASGIPEGPVWVHCVSHGQIVESVLTDSAKVHIGKHAIVWYDAGGGYYRWTGDHLITTKELNQ